MLLDESHRMIQETARRFAQEQLTPQAAERDRNAAFPGEEIKMLKEPGFLGMTIPKENNIIVVAITRQGLGTVIILNWRWMDVSDQTTGIGCRQ